MNKSFIPAILVLLLLLALHIIGFTNHFYINIWWYDVMMHIIGGVGIGASFYWFFKTIYKNNPEKSVSIKAILFTLICGLVWEGIEAYYGIAGAPVGTVAYYIDTLKDLLNDTIGAIIFLFLAKIYK